MAIFYERRERGGLGFGGLGKPRKSSFCRSKVARFQKVFETYGDQNTES